MTDLERLWDDYDAGRAPVTAILAAAAGERHRRRRLLVRPLLTAGVVTGLAGAFVAGTLVDGSGPSTPPGTEALPERVAFQADLEPARSCADLLSTYRARARTVVGPWGWGDHRTVALSKSLNDYSALDSIVGAAKPRSAAVPQTDRVTNSETGTNVQETGIDEPDTVKTDGKVLATVRDDRLTIYDVTGTSTTTLGSLALPGIGHAEILLSGDTVVAIGDDGKGEPEHPGTRVLTISIADPKDPKVADDVRYDAASLSARQHGSAIRLVLASGLPDLDFVSPGGKRSAEQALRENRAVIDKTTIEDWLPSVTSDGKTRPLLDCTDVAVPSDDLVVDTTSIVGFDAGQPTRLDAIGLAGRTGIAYESADHLYLATQSAQGLWDRRVLDCVGPCEGPVVGKDTGSSYLFDFALDGTAATHVASGEVEGSIRDRWSMDEAGDVLRVAVGPTEQTGAFNSVVTFRRQGTELVEDGRLDGLGPNEDLKSVRWFDDLAVLVTFRKVDPLYAVNLTDTAHPRLIGKLKVPGFSTYLHPLGSWRMVGVGEGPSKDGWGAQVGLFDVRDITKVRQLDSFAFGRGFQALAGTDPRAFTWLPEKRAVITVLERYAGRRIGYVAVFRLSGGQLYPKLVQVEYGDDVDDVRAVPMPDGRVVLVTGDKAQFFEL
ncbi:beta-propeller domain-containing protein [Nocardioides sp. LML1-1-1.1]|uniref:beta-propeller domain-containing protein n=1 Tax=Nocardioides sp. LML1-1-1.1 TaxID=3135248 RepID=UPI00343C1D32